MAVKIIPILLVVLPFVSCAPQGSNTANTPDQFDYFSRGNTGDAAYDTGTGDTTYDTETSDTTYYDEYPTDESNYPASGIDQFESTRTGVDDQENQAHGTAFVGSSVTADSTRRANDNAEQVSSLSGNNVPLIYQSPVISEGSSNAGGDSSGFLQQANTKRRFSRSILALPNSFANLRVKRSTLGAPVKKPRKSFQSQSYVDDDHAFRIIAQELKLVPKLPGDFQQTATFAAAIQNIPARNYFDEHDPELYLTVNEELVKIFYENDPNKAPEILRRPGDAIGNADPDVFNAYKTQRGGDTPAERDDDEV